MKEGSFKNRTKSRSYNLKSHYFPGDRRGMILEALYFCIAEKGYRRTSITDIAGKANISRGLLYRYFKDKEEIQMELLDYFVKDYITPLLWDVAKIPDPYEKLQASLKFFTDIIDPDVSIYTSYSIHVFQDYLSEALYNDRIRQRISQLIKLIHDNICSILEEGIQAGVFAPMDSEITSVILISSFLGAMQQGLILDKHGTFLKKIDSGIRKILENLLKLTLESTAEVKPAAQIHSFNGN